MSQSAENPARCRRRVIFHGRVQGVGFRYTTQRIAARHPVGGYVRNLPDGTVELQAQGTSLEVETFLTEIEEHFRGNITDRELTEMEPGDELSAGFRIAY